MEHGTFPFSSLIPSPHCITQPPGGCLCEYVQSELSLYGPAEDQRLVQTALACFPDSALERVTPLEFFCLCTGAPPSFDTDFFKEHPHDSYRLQIGAHSLALTALSAAGLFYGLQTLQKLRQLGGADLPCCEISDWADTPIRCEYLEFRNFHPPFDHALEYFAGMARRHINALIVEFEDKRPFPTLPFLQTAKGAFQESQIRQLQQAARRYFVTLIPLQQSFGHLEYVLKHPQYAPLREVAQRPDGMCPLKPGSEALGRQLIQDICRLFPDAPYLHLGGDEVWSLGSCEACRASGLSRQQLFIQFMNKMIDEACKNGKTPLFWHDMLMDCPEEDLRKLDKRAVVVVWIYNGSDLVFRAERFISVLQKLGFRVWGGNSVRCWDAAGNQNYPVLTERKKNITSWNQVVQDQQLDGVVHTNWSAYSALGSPYGIYESSFFPAAFAADCAWNHQAVPEGFLQKYLLLHHGVQPGCIPPGNWQFEDYYRLLPLLQDSVCRDRQFAELMQAVAQFESVSVREPTAALQLFRVVAAPEKKEEWESLYEKYQQTFPPLLCAKEALRAALKPFLTPEKLDEYLLSRYYLWEIVEARLLDLARACPAAASLPFVPVLTNPHQPD